MPGVLSVKSAHDQLTERTLVNEAEASGSVPSPLLQRNLFLLILLSSVGGTGEAAEEMGKTPDAQKSGSEGEAD